MLRILVILAIVFVLTYNPRSGTLDRFISAPEKPQPGCCSTTKYRADNPVQCESPYYEGLQFGNTELGCPTRIPSVNMGAIV